jgi:two-component system NarL family sensor kinase
MHRRAELLPRLVVAGTTRPRCPGRDGPDLAASVARRGSRRPPGGTPDPSDHTRAEDPLRQREERFRRHFELGGIGMAITSPVTGIVDVNDELCRILGYERSELLRKTWPEMTHADDLAADLAQFQRVMSGAIDAYALDKRWIRKDGAVIHGTLSVTCVRRTDGAVDYFVALVQDLTERTRAHDVLARARDELEGRVTEHTRELSDLNSRLLAEVEERKRADLQALALKSALQGLMTRLIDGQELQSKQLARELHDVFSQQLAAIAMDLEHVVVRRKGARRHTLDSTLRAVISGVNKLAGDVHGMSRQIHPAILDDLGLSAALRSECLFFSDHYKRSAEFTSVDVPPGVAEEIALCLYRVAQESLRNIGKHAGTATVDVALHGGIDHLSLIITDHGIGFEPEKTRGKGGLGLVSMEERMRNVGGTLSIASAPGAGTRVEARVPLRR